MQKGHLCFQEFYLSLFFYSLLNIRQNEKRSEDSVTTADNVTNEPGKKCEVTEHEPQNQINNGSEKKE